MSTSASTSASANYLAGRIECTVCLAEDGVHALSFFSRELLAKHYLHTHSVLYWSCECTAIRTCFKCECTHFAGRFREFAPNIRSRVYPDSDKQTERKEITEWLRTNTPTEVSGRTHRRTAAKSISSQLAELREQIAQLTKASTT